MDQLWSDIISISCGGVAAGLALYFVQVGHGAFKDWKESKRVYEWMKTNEQKNNWGCRSTRTIASYNNLTEDRVRYICSAHTKIFLSTGPKEDLWSTDEQRLRRLDKMPE